MEQVLGRNAQPELDRLGKFGASPSRSVLKPHQNRPYATSQINDLTAKLASARQSLGKATSDLKKKSAAPGQGATGDGTEQSFAGVEEEETALTKAARDR